MKSLILKNINFLVGLILALSLLWPLFAAPYFTHHDDVQIIRVYEMDKCFKDHQIPCRWVPDLGGLYGYPIFNYYGPLPYYFGEFIYILTHSLLWSAKIMFAFSFIGAYFFMYLLGNKIWGKFGGSLAAIFYTFAPYHALDFYVRGAMGEMWGLMLFPAIFWAVVRLKEKSNIANFLLLSLTISALLTSHNLSTMIFLPFLLIWIVLLFAQKISKKFLFFCFLSLCFSILISSFYFLPMIFEKNLVHIETTVEGYFSYTEHFKGLRKLFLDYSWGYGASVREVPGGEKDGISFQIGWVHLLGWLLSLIAAFILWRKNRWTSWVIIFSSIGVLISVFMIHPRSEIIWKSIEPLKYLQFPWRFLELIIFFISFICGSISYTLVRKRKYIWLVLIVLIAVSNFMYFRPEKFVYTDDGKFLSGQNWDKQIKRSIFDYLPIYAKEPPAELATQRYEILTGDSLIYDFKEGTNWINFKTDTHSHTIIRLSQYYFPNWKIFVDGNETKFEYKSNNLALMTIILGKGKHEVNARLNDTPIRFIGNFVTLASFIVVLFLYISQFSKVREWIKYYGKRIN